MEVLKAIDPGKNTYFAFRVQAGSQEMEQIRSCPVRYWNQQCKVWLIPYSLTNWKYLTNKIGHLPYQVLSEVIYLDSTPGRYVDKAKSTIKQPKQVITIELSAGHKLAIMRMKEQLVLNRYQFNTHRTYIACIIEFFGYFNHMPANELEYEDIKAFMLYKINVDGIAESTQNGLINAIKFYYEKVEKREKFYVYDLRPRKPKQLPGFLSKEDTVRLLSVTANIKHRTILQLIYSAGLRLGELTRLKVKDINFDMGIIQIKCAKGKKDRITKLAKSIIPLLRQYLDEYKPSYYLFEGQTGGKYSERSVEDLLHQAAQRSIVDENTTVHTPRNTFDTHLILYGMGLRIVQELMGHSSIKTTTIYTHITDQMKKDVISPLDYLDL